MAHASSPTRVRSITPAWWLGLIALAALGVATVLLSGWWLPAVGGGLGGTPPPQALAPAGEEHGHEHGGHDQINAIELSESARKNIGLMLGKVELTSFIRSITLPGIAVERPGRSTVEVT